MWKIIKNILLTSLLLFALFVPAYSYTMEQVQDTQIVISTQQWTRLKEIMLQQENLSDQLEVKLNNLEKNSTEQSQQLTTLRQQLTDCKNQLIEAKTKLLKAEISLTEAENSLKKNEELLTTLNSQIKQMENEITRLKRQRNFAEGIAVTLAIAYIFK